MPLCMRATKCRINTHDPIRLRSSFRVEGIGFVRDSITRFPQACLSSSRFREGAAWNASRIAALAKRERGKIASHGEHQDAAQDHLARRAGVSIATTTRTMSHPEGRTSTADLTVTTTKGPRVELRFGFGDRWR